LARTAHIYRVAYPVFITGNSLNNRPRSGHIFIYTVLANYKSQCRRIMGRAQRFDRSCTHTTSTQATSTHTTSTQATSKQATSTQATSTQATYTQATYTQATSTKATSTQATSTQATSKHTTLTQATSGSVQELVRTHSRSYAHMHTRNHTHSLSHIHTHTLAAHTSICSFKTRNFSAARSFRRASSSSFSCSVRGAVSGRRGGGTGACSCVDVCACVCVCVCVCV